MSVGVVPEGFDKRVRLEGRLDKPAKHACATAVNDADVAKPRGVRLPHVLVDDRFRVSRLERVQIQRAVYRQPERLPFAHGFTYAAVTAVRRPPRAVKSPTTAIRRGWQAATRSSRIWFVAAS